MLTITFTAIMIMMLMLMITNGCLVRGNGGGYKWYQEPQLWSRTPSYALRTLGEMDSGSARTTSRITRHKRSKKAFKTCLVASSHTAYVENWFSFQWLSSTQFFFFFTYTANSQFI